MRKLTIKSLLTTAILLIIILTITYFSIYNPLYRTLEETLLDNFIYIAETNKISYEYIIKSRLESARSISSRTMIKNKILEYKEGLINFEELKKYTKPKYNEGIEAVNNVLYSARIVDGKKIATYGTKVKNINNIKYVDELTYDILLENEKIYLLVYSPIKEKKLIGIDMIIFDLSNNLSKMELDDISVNIVKDYKMKKYQNKRTINPLISEYKESNNKIYLNVFYDIGKDMYLHINMPKDSLYYNFDKSTRLSSIRLVWIFIISFIILIFTIVLIVRDKIMELYKSNEKHKRESEYDSLTGAYTRLYLDKWIKNNKEKIEYAMVFIDVDNFKNINDSYGHQKGDEALKTIVLLIKNEIRSNDFIIRYGGDEFIILLESASKEIAKKTMERINQRLEMSDLLNFEICFSYGVGKLNNINEFNDVLKEIDLKMYKMKECDVKK